MKNDLISRSVLIDKLEKWKLANEERGYDTAKDLVQEMIDLTKEQESVGGGWIPVSSGKLPKVTKLYLVTKMCENDGSPIYDTCHEVFWTKDKKWDCERDEYCEWKVTAWQERLKPYKAEREGNA